jgi:hypothetical protein
MWPYWIMFLLPSVAALSSIRSGGAMANGLRGAAATIVWLLGTLLVGFRFQVGGDWQNYFHYLLQATDVDVTEVLVNGDPAYRLLNWISAKLDWGMFGVNLICGAIFSYGLLAFCRRQPSPWLAIAVAIPYLVIVVAMGYTRQGVALGLEMLGLLSLSNKSVFGFVLWVALAATFHKSAVVLLPIVALASSRNRYWSIAWVGVTGVVLYYLLLSNDVDNLVRNYVDAQMQSDGAGIRLAMNVLPAAILLIWQSRFGFTESEAPLWRWLAIISLGLQGFFLVSPSASTAMDRIALYMLPLQIMVFARLPYVFDMRNSGRRGAPETHALSDPGARRQAAGKDTTGAITAAVLIYYGLVLLVWLNFANNARYWVPYRFYLFEAAF